MNDTLLAVGFKNREILLYNELFPNHEFVYPDWLKFPYEKSREFKIIDWALGPLFFLNKHSKRQYKEIMKYLGNYQDISIKKEEYPNIFKLKSLFP